VANGTKQSYSTPTQSSVKRRGLSLLLLLWLTSVDGVNDSSKPLVCA